MALPVIENNSSIVKSLNENADRLEEIKQITISGPTTDLLSLNQQTLDDIKLLLSNQLDLDKQAAELQRLQLENEENAQRENELEAERAARLARESAARQAAMQGGTGATASAGGGNWLATALGIGGAAAASGGLVRALKSGLASTLKNVFKGGLLIGLGDMFGDEIGKFLGENVATVLEELGLKPEFSNKIAGYLREETGSLMKAGGWSKLLFGKATIGIIAKLLGDFLGIPNLLDEDVQNEISDNIANKFGEEYSKLFDSSVDFAESGGTGGLIGAILGNKLLGKKGGLVGLVAGFLLQRLGLGKLLNDPDFDVEDFQQNVTDEMGTILGGAGLLGATLLGPKAVAATARRFRGRPSGDSPTPDAETTSRTPAQSRADVAQRAARTLTPSQLEASGLRRVGQGASATIQRTAGGFASQADIIAAAERSATSRFPRLALLKRIPGINSVIALTDLYFILNDDTTTKAQKTIMIAGVFGGIGGATLGTIIGGIGGAPGGPAALATALVGGTIGYFFGEFVAEALAKHIAEWLLGDVGDINLLPQSIIDQVISPAIQNAIPARPAPPALNPAPDNQTAAAQNQSSARTSQSQTPSLPSVGSLDTSALSSLPSSTDLQSMDLTRQSIDRKYEGITKALNQAMGLSEEGRPANEVAAEALEAVQEASAQGLLSDTILEPGGILGEKTLRVYTADQRNFVADMFTNHKEKVDAFLSLDTESQELVLDRPQIDVLRNVSVRLESSVRRINAAQTQPAQATPDTPALSNIPVSSAEQQTTEPAETDQLVTDLGVLHRAANAFPAGDPRRMEYENEIQNKAAQLKELYTVTTATASAIPPVDRNEVSELSKQLSTSSQVVIAQPVTNVVNNINNDNSSTSVASSGSGTNIPSGRTYNIDSSLTRVNRGRVYA